MRAFSDALDFIPMALAENSGLSSIQTVANIKSRQIAENNSRLGIDCMQNGDCGKDYCMYSRTSIIRISIIRTLGYPNANINFKIPKDDLIFCKTK